MTGAPEEDDDRAAKLWVFRGISILFGLLTVWGLLELLALVQVVDYRLVFGTASPVPRANPLNRLDHGLIYVHRPHQHLQGTMPTGDIGATFDISGTEPHPYDVQTDRDGFRNSTDMETAEVVLIGDSYLEGVIVPQDEIVSSQLARILKQNVLNLGQVGYGPQQEFLSFKRYGLPRKPKVCVWLFFEGNDLFDFMDYRQLVNNWDGWTADLHSFSKRSLSTNLYRYFVPIIIPKATQNGIYGVLPDGDKTYFFPQGSTLDGRQKRGLEFLTGELKAFAESLALENVRLILAYVPNKSRVYRHICQFPKMPCDQFLIETLPDEIQTMLKSAAPNTTFLDLTEPLYQAARRGEDVYFKDDSHWTAAGHRIVAEELAKALKSPESVPQSPSPDSLQANPGKTSATD